MPRRTHSTMFRQKGVGSLGGIPRFDVGEAVLLYR